jgi:hypothetical protein
MRSADAYVHAASLTNGEIVISWSSHTLGPVGQLDQRLGQDPRLIRRDPATVRVLNHDLPDVHGGAARGSGPPPARRLSSVAEYLATEQYRRGRVSIALCSLARSRWAG